VILSSTPPKQFHTYRNNSSSSFFREHCQLDDSSDEWRHPKPPWKQRTPGFLLIGAKKAGTTALSYWLGQHPHIYKGSQKELKYFLPPRFSRLSASDGKVLVTQVRDDLYREFATAIQNADFLSDSHSLAFEATPGYLLYSTASRIPIFCAMPWIKLLITLRNPVERTYSNYNYIVHAQTKMRKQRKKQQQQQKQQNQQNQRLLQKEQINSNQTQQQQQKQYRYVRLGGPFSNRTITFEEAILEDIAQLKKAGVLQSKIPMSEFAGSIAERQAWTRYQGSKTKGNAQWLDRLVGRSLYILQLQEWYDAMRHDLGRDPFTEILVVRNEDMKSQPDVVYDRILKWLKLPPINSNNNSSSIFQSKMVTQFKSAPLTNETRTMLRELFQPYNQRLYDLLGWNNSTSVNRVWA